MVTGWHYLFPKFDMRHQDPHQGTQFCVWKSCALSACVRIYPKPLTLSEILDLTLGSALPEIVIAYGWRPDAYFKAVSHSSDNPHQGV